MFQAVAPPVQYTHRHWRPVCSRVCFRSVGKSVAAAVNTNRNGKPALASNHPFECHLIMGCWDSDTSIFLSLAVRPGGFFLNRPATVSNRQALLLYAASSVQVHIAPIKWVCERFSGPYGQYAYKKTQKRRKCIANSCCNNSILP